MQYATTCLSGLIGIPVHKKRITERREVLMLMLPRQKTFPVPPSKYELFFILFIPGNKETLSLEIGLSDSHVERIVIYGSKGLGL